MITIDVLIKILPIFLAIIPFFVWLDKAKRFSHKRKFYLNRLEAVKEYLDNYYNSDKDKFEKDCAAQALVCSEKTSHLEVDYVIKEFPQRFFLVIKKLITARHFIKTSIEDNQIFLTAPSSKKNYKNKRLILIGAYLSSIVIIPINKILVFIIKKWNWFTPFEVDGWLIVVGEFGTLIIGTGIAIISGLLFVGIDAAIEIYDDLKVKYIPKNQ
ncbi:hypothetical protein E0H89_15425 [Acinetobacter sp. ANC 3781]|uniref:hypothetical protein n=1 Tax=Acinetobacter sp. ANC 3781 TaxID=2529835 RepID=UPI00103B8D06|nr:hypothetical protein [Acinetobacter sp. ANC 3781]TCB71409.1 hypothetical protein E0H89_15425 [Acinetobacter sp. ANC 3781]